MNTPRKFSDYDQVIILMRHAESEANVAYRQTNISNPTALYYPVSGSDESVRLSEYGKHQADAAGRKLRQILSADRPFDEILVSELKRTEETALHVMREIGNRSPVVVDPRLNKRAQGMFWNMTYLGVEVLHNDEYQKYLADLEKGGLNYAPPGGSGQKDGESYNQLFARTDDLVNEQLRRTDPFLTLWVGHLSSSLSIQRRFDRVRARAVVQLNDSEAFVNADFIAYGRMIGLGKRFGRINLDEE